MQKLSGSEEEVPKVDGASAKPLYCLTTKVGSVSGFKTFRTTSNTYQICLANGEADCSLPDLSHESSCGVFFGFV